MDLILRQPLLQGFGVRLNDRTIRIARINTTAAREQFRSQLLDLAASVLNLYYGLVAANDELEGPPARPGDRAELSRRHQQGDRRGSHPGHPVAARRSRSLHPPPGTAHRAGQRAPAGDPVEGGHQPHRRSRARIRRHRAWWIASRFPIRDDLPPLRNLVATAMAKRPDVAVIQLPRPDHRINLAGTANPLLPNLNVTLQLTTAASAEWATWWTEPPRIPILWEAYGNAFAQTFQHDFPNNIATIGFSAPIGNRGAQADYGIDQLQYRQSQVVQPEGHQRHRGGCRRARGGAPPGARRYDAARDTRTLQEQLLAADQRRFASGGENTTFDTLMADQRALVTAQIAEVNALAAYARARTSLDHVLGETLDKNHITLEEGLNGRVDRQPQLPGVPDREK